MALPENRPLSESHITTSTTSVGATPVAAYAVAPVRGRLVKVYSILGGAITTANAALAVTIGGASVSGSMAIPFSGSAAGKVNEHLPTGANACNEGDAVVITPSGASGSSIKCDFLLIFERD